MQPLGPLAVAAVTGSLLLSGCSGSDDIRPTPPPPGVTSRGIDAASYVEDYESPETEDYAASGSMSGTAPASGSMRSSGYGVAADGGPELPGPLDDDTFVDEGTSGFVDAGEDGLSTFALDVDTGSWGVARTLLRDGLRPPPASIRVEEWVNAQPSDEAADLPEPDGTVGVSAESALAPSLADGTQLVRVGVNTRAATEADRRPVNLTLVVDRSGSMDIRERLGLVQSSLALLADSLRDDDTVAVVSFEDTATPILEPTPVSDTDSILAAIDELKPGGSTNLEAGLRLGYDEARKSFRDDATNIVLLASDGFGDQSVDAGELGAGHHATALYEVRLADGVEPGTPIGTATVQWTSVEDGGTERASTDVVAAEDVQPDGALALEAVVADLAQLLKGAAPYDDRDLTLADLEERAAALDDADVPGAAGVATMIRLAEQGRSEPGVPEDGPPLR
jgi:hypothetical protein